MNQRDDDFILVGGGVIGLSLAWTLSHEGARVRVLDQHETGREASWAGAGILPPAVENERRHPLEQLAGLSRRLHRDWAARLREQTDIDTGYRDCGGVYVARTPGEAASLRGLALQWLEEGLTLQRLDPAQLGAIHPPLQRVLEDKVARAAFWAPQEGRLRNPRHLTALRQACLQQGVRIEANNAVTGWTMNGDRVVQLLTQAGPRRGGAYCLTAGAWTGALMRAHGLTNGILPIRGQMVLFGPGATDLRSIINEGSRYLVPRDDGRLLAGSTEEETGFQKGTTPEALADLRRFACDMLPELQTANVEATWSGLRPGSFDGLPYLGRVSDCDNLYIAAGHFRSGLFLSPATAIVMTQLMLGQSPVIDLHPFRPSRG